MRFMLKEVLARRGMTLAELSRRSGLSRASLHNLLGASHNPTFATMKALAAALEVGLDDLVEDEPTGCIRTTIFEWAQERGMSEGQLAQKLGYPVEEISRMASGRQAITPAFAGTALLAFGPAVASLFSVGTDQAALSFRPSGSKPLEPLHIKTEEVQKNV